MRYRASVMMMVALGSCLCKGYPSAQAALDAAEKYCANQGKELESVSLTKTGPSCWQITLPICEELGGFTPPIFDTLPEV